MNVLARRVVPGLVWLLAGWSPAVAGAQPESAPAPRSEAALPAPVALALRSLDLPESGVSVWVQRLGDDAPLVRFNADVPRNPASTLKLVTTFAALEGLGPAYTWHTDVHLATPLQDGVVAGDVWLRGHGDPFLVAEEYWKLTDALRRRGLRRIEGDLVFDTSFFDLPPEDRVGMGFRVSLDNEDGPRYQGARHER